MMQRGRKSAEALQVVHIDSVARLRPPPGLTPAEDALFRRVVAQCAADHFTASDTPLLVAYCQAVLLTRWAFKRLGEDGSAFLTWQQAARTLATLSTKPHGSQDHHSAPAAWLGALGL